MALGFSIALTLAVLALVAVPAVRLGKRLGTPAAERNATPEEQAERKRLRGARRRAELAALTTWERVLFYGYYALSIPAMPAGVLLTIFGHGATRTAGGIARHRRLADGRSRRANPWRTGQAAQTGERDSIKPGRLLKAIG
ncbi:MAG TPA: hypothetical protein VGO29_07520 [Solirubrobacteraceae bacterium]|jgi:hypothetical protein|nr:hypothetical protein [Solirubrobacteraceae bacterium]